MPMLTTLRMRLPVWPFQRAAPDAIGELGHLVQHGMHLRHNVLAVHEDGGVFRRAQRDVQHGAVLGDVDLVPAEHRVDALAQAGFLRQLHQQLEGLVGDAVLGVIQEEARRLPPSCARRAWGRRRRVPAGASFWAVW